MVVNVHTSIGRLATYGCTSVSSRFKSRKRVAAVSNYIDGKT